MTDQDKETAEIIQFREGLKASLDPYNKDRLRGGTAKTTLSSAWLYKKCPRCSHSFRLDDAVYITTEGQVLHDSPALDCAGRQGTADDDMADEVFEFYSGIIESYLPERTVLPQIVTPGNPVVAHLLDAPGHGFKRYQCGICAHTIRPNDIIVLCPCHPEAPGCRLAIHLDPFRGLNCWGAWNSNVKEAYCPAFSQKLQA